MWRIIPQIFLDFLSRGGKGLKLVHKLGFDGRLSKKCLGSVCLESKIILGKN